MATHQPDLVVTCRSWDRQKVLESAKSGGWHGGTFRTAVVEGKNPPPVFSDSPNPFMLSCPRFSPVSLNVINDYSHHLWRMEQAITFPGDYKADELVTRLRFGAPPTMKLQLWLLDLHCRNRNVSNPYKYSTLLDVSGAIICSGKYPTQQFNRFRALSSDIRAKLADVDGRENSAECEFVYQKFFNNKNIIGNIIIILLRVTICITVCDNM